MKFFRNMRKNEPTTLVSEGIAAAVAPIKNDAIEKRLDNCMAVRSNERFYLPLAKPFSEIVSPKLAFNIFRRATVLSGNLKPPGISRLFCPEPLNLLI